MPAQQPIEPLHRDLVAYFEERDSLPLEADDVAALKHTDDYIGIFWDHGLGYMRVVKHSYMQGGFRIPEAVRYVPVRTEFDHGTRGFCCHIQHTSNGNEARAWRTIAAGLRAGDLLVARWFADNATQGMKDIGWSADECWLEVWPQGNQARRKTFMLGTWVGRAENPTRMCRRNEND